MKKVKANNKLIKDIATVAKYGKKSKFLKPKNASKGKPSKEIDFGEGQLSIFRELNQQGFNMMKVVLALPKGKTQQILLEVNPLDFTMCLTGRGVSCRVKVYKKK